jgi:hypothetical protein
LRQRQALAHVNGRGAMRQPDHDDHGPLPPPAT